MGSYDGQLSFWEPMMPIEFFTQQKDMSYTEDVTYQGQTIDTLPTSYSMTYDDTSKRITLILTGNVQKPEYDDCLTMDNRWKKGELAKKKAEDVVECYEMCRDFDKKGKKCKAYSFNADAKKSCRLYSKNNKSKSTDGWMLAKKNCHPYDGKVKN